MPVSSASPNNSVGTLQKTLGGHVVYSARLARSGRYNIVFKLIRSGDEDGTITAKFVCTDRLGHVRVFFKEIGDVLGDRYSAEVADYAGIGRKQVFVTAGVRATKTCILDCDGTKPRTLYEEFRLYVPTMVHARGNRWFLEEAARKDSIGSDLGTYYETEDDWRYRPYSPSEERIYLHGGYGVPLVTRLLQWNGEAFSPVEPGRSHVVVTSYARYLRSHGIPVPHRYSHPVLKHAADD